MGKNDCSNNAEKLQKKTKKESQQCPVCGKLIGVVAGSHDAICTNCGFKDPCCE